MRFHINAKGEPGACRAAKHCPFGDFEKDHYSSKDDARQAYEASRPAFDSSGTEHKAKHAAIEAMLSSTLTTPLRTAEAPTWWSSYASDYPVTFENYPHTFPAPEHLGNIVVEGKTLAAVWQHQSLQHQDYWPLIEKGMVTPALVMKDAETGEEVGSLRLTLRTEDAFNRSFGKDELTVLRFVEREKGFKLGFYDEDDKDVTEAMSPEELSKFKRQLWLKARKHKIPLTAEDRQRAETMPEEELNEECEFLIRQHKESWDSEVALWDRPEPAYSTVNDAYLGKGVGAALYTYAAQRLAEDDLPLCAASARTPSALKLWENLKRIDELKPYWADRAHQKGSLPVLDLRK